jgi:hypothetical protein
VSPDLSSPTPSTSSAIKVPDSLCSGLSQSLVETEETPEKIEGDLDACEPAA